MDTNALKKFAQSARNLLIAQVTARLDMVLAEGAAARRERPAAIARLEAAAKSNRGQVIEQAAYTWFNRFTALRFMDVTGLTNPRVVSPADGATRPEILAEAMAGNLPDRARPEIAEYLNGTRPANDGQAEAYRLLLIHACNEWHHAMPYMFERADMLDRAEESEWTEFDFDRAVWNIPAEKMKMRRLHRVPLSTQVMSLFEQLWDLTGTGQYCFPGFRTPRRPMSENTVNGALRALGFGPEEMTAHGFRAMAATLLNESGKFNPDAIERQLAHMENNGVRRAYTRGEYWNERVTMMQWWSDELDRLREGAKVLKPDFGAKRAGTA